MKRRLIYLAFFALLPLVAYNQEVKNYVYTVGVFGGIDNNINGYRMIPNYYGNNFSASGITSWNFGFDYGYMLTNKLRPRIEAKYLQMRYYADWKDANLEALKESTVFLFAGNHLLAVSKGLYKNKSLVLDAVIQHPARNTTAHQRNDAVNRSPAISSPGQCPPGARWRGCSLSPTRDRGPCRS